MKNRLLSVFIVALTIFIFEACQKDSVNTTDSNIELLTNNSLKTWYLTKIIAKESKIVYLPSCVIDDENKFIYEGMYLTDNMGTIYNKIQSFGAVPILCKDTARILDTLFWCFNKKQDSLIIIHNNIISRSKILKLTNDSLVIDREYRESILQREFYAVKMNN